MHESMDQTHNISLTENRQTHSSQDTRTQRTPDDEGTKENGEEIEDAEMRRNGRTMSQRRGITCASNVDLAT